MPAWLPAVKAVLPYVAQIVTAAIPVFTKKDKAGTDDVARQIAELQDAVTHNAESLKILAAQLQEVINDIGAAGIEKDIRTNRWLAVAAILLSSAAIALWLYTALR